MNKQPDAFRGAVVVVVLLAIWSFVHFTYFLNPLTFRRDDVTALPWNWYVRPVQIEYVLHADSNKIKVVTDEAEIQKVIAELKKGVALPDPDIRWDAQTGSQWVHIDLVRGNSRVILMDVKGAWDQGVLFISGGTQPVPVALSDDLKALLKRRFAEAQ